MEYLTRKMIIPFNGEAAKTIVLRDLQTGNVLNATTGACTSTTAWAEGEIEGARHDIGGDWVFTIPTVIASTREYILAVYDAAAGAVTKDTVPSASPLIYNVATGRTYSDLVPAPKRL